MAMDYLKGKNILITDDDYTCYKYILVVLENSGANIHWANNGLSAVDFVRSNAAIDLIFMDLAMPVMSGKQAIEHIMQINKDIPIIIQSGTLNDLDSTDRFKGNFEFLEKPYKPKQIYEAIRNIFKINEAS